MADEPQTNTTVLRAINWREVFPFTHIFRGFRIAVHPSKLVLGLVALLTLYVGGRIMDGLWATSSLALPGEIEHFGADKPDKAVSFTQWREAELERLRVNYASELVKFAVTPDDKSAKEPAQSFDRLSELKGKRMFRANEVEMKAARDAQKTAHDEADKKTDAVEKAKAHRDADSAFYAARKGIDARVDADMARFKQIVPRGIFNAFFEYEVGEVNAVAYSVYMNNWLVSGGVKDHAVNFFSVGPVWLWKHHLLYAALFTSLFLLTWAVFGGAISRIAAVQVCRDEKISVRQALRFSLNKVLSFVFAPVIPLVIILVIGLVVALGGLLMYIPVVGPLLVGVLLFLALIAGLLITLVFFGTLGGMNLMFPTIAVEGSDSFDAISRSFSYVFARPWRMLFYTAVAVAYGSLTYLFVRFFVWIVLLVTHGFTAWFLNEEGAAYSLNKMWPEPAAFWAFKLPYDINFAGLDRWDSIAAFLMSIWVYLFVGLVGAFAISFYLSVNTLIYVLMRREVDATEIEDVYMEEAEDDLSDVAPIIPVPVSMAPATTPSTIATTTTDFPPVNPT